MDVPTASTTTESPRVGPLDAVRMLRSAGEAMLAQVSLHAELALVEWAEERQRIGRLLLAGTLCFASLLGLVLAVGALVLAFAWETPYRVPAAAAVVIAYGAGTFLAWRRVGVLAALSGRAFAATREELAADIALLRSRL